MEVEQLLEDVTPIQSARMLEESSPSDHSVHTSRNSIGDATASVSGIRPLADPKVVLSSPMGVAFDEVIRNEQPGRSQPCIPKAREVTASIHFVTLITGRKQTSASLDRRIVLALPVKVVRKVWCSVESLTPDKAAWSFELRLHQVGDHDSFCRQRCHSRRFVFGTKASPFFRHIGRNRYRCALRRLIAII
jgi:hypothetical protein